MKHTYLVGKSGRMGRAALTRQLTPQSPSPVPITQRNDGQTDSAFDEKSMNDDATSK